MNVLLINLPTGVWYKDEFSKSNSMPPLGLLYLHAVLEENGHKCEVIDLAVEKMNKDTFIENLKTFNPKIVGFSTYNESWNELKVLSNLVSQTIKDVDIVCGGAFATFCFEDILNETSSKYVIRGEGEVPLLKLCNMLENSSYTIDSLKNINGLCFKVAGEIIDGNISDRIKDLNMLPIVDRTAIDVDKYTLPYTISTSRGCPGDCIFCSSKAFWGQSVKFRSAENIFKEVLYLEKEFNISMFYITDDTFTISTKNCLSFCEMLKKSNKKFIWGCESRADVVNEYLIKTMYEAGCRKIQFGFESADNSILKKLKKYVTIEQIEEATKIAQKYNMHIQLSYIIGHAFDTEETIQKTIEYANYFHDKYGAHVVCSVNTPFPGTEQYERAEELGIKIHAQDWSQFVLGSPIINTNYLSRQEIHNFYNSIQTKRMGVKS